MIVALGTGFFVGFKSAGPSMSKTAEEYFKSNNLMDIRIQSPIGLTDDDINSIKKIQGVNGVMGQKFVDALILVNGQPEIDIDGSQISTRAYGINLAKLQEYYYGVHDENFINRPTLIEGTYPTKNNQCLVDESALSTPDSFKIGNIISFEADRKTDLSGVSVTEFEIVGIIRSPYYLSFERGNSLVGSGKIGTYIYIPDSVFSNDYYSEIYVSLNDSDNYDPFSEEYSDYVDSFTPLIESVSTANITKRADELKKSLPKQIADAEKEYNSSKKLIDDGLKTAESQVKLFQKYVDDPEGSYNDAVNQAANALGIAEQEFNGNSQQYNQAIQTYNQNLQAYKAATAEQKEKYSKWLDANQKYNAAANMLTTAQNTVNSTKQLISSTNTVITSTSDVLTSLEDYQNGKLNDDQLSQILGSIQAINPDLYASVTSLSAVSMATEAIALINPYLTQQKEQLAVYEEQLAQKQKELEEYNKTFETAAVYLATAKAAFEEADAKLNAAYAELEAFHSQLQGSQSDLSMAQIELMISQNAVSNDLDMLKATITNAKEYLDKAIEEYNNLKKISDTTLVSSFNKIENSKKLYSKLDSAKWNIYNRTNTPGFGSYEGAVNTVSALSNIFPVVFFLVAALVCLTTMTRMVEEERIMLGTFTALGFTRVEIMAKYLIYAFLASAIGGVFGSVVGFVIFPTAVAFAADILFDVPEIILTYRWPYAITGIFCSIGVTVLATYYTCHKSLNVLPASLMRSKAPVSGKRVLLEKVPAIWTRLSFIWKVTMRNVFRNMKRFVMATMGVAGCTALLVAAFGLNDSINATLDKQFIADDRVWSYDMQIVLGGSYDTTLGTCAPFETVKSKAQIKSAMLEHMKVYDATADGKDTRLETYVVVAAEPGEVSNYINLADAKTGKQQYLTDSGAVITQKLAKELDIDVGESIKIEVSEENSVYVPVAAIVENYTFHYIYMSPVVYKYVFGANPAYNYIVANLALENMEAAQKNAFAEELMDVYDISAIAYTSQIQDSLQNILDSISLVVVIMIVCAGLLAFIVLYNLSIINITERLKEIATIKVLGFDDMEVSAYIFRENILLTVIGIVEGIISGVIVHRIVLMMADVDIITYGYNIDFSSFIYSVILAFGFSMFVNVVLHGKLKKVEMVESLKSIE